MPSTYSTDLRIELIANGEQSGTWGTTTNSNLGTVIEDAIAGAATVSVGSVNVVDGKANYALTAQNGSADQARCAYIILTTTTTANFAVYVPPTASKLYAVHNNSSYVATVYCSTIIGNTTAAGSGVAIPAGKKVLLRSDGVNITEQFNHVVESFSTGGNLTVDDGTTIGASAVVGGDVTARGVLFAYEPLYVNSTAYLDTLTPQTVTQTSAVDIADETITLASAAFVNDTAVMLTSSGTMPTGLSTNTLYYVVDTSATTYFSGTGYINDGTGSGSTTAGTVLTITNVHAGVIGANTAISGTGVTTGTTVASLGVGTYIVNNSQYVASTTITGTYAGQQKIKLATTPGGTPVNITAVGTGNLTLTPVALANTPPLGSSTKAIATTEFVTNTFTNTQILQRVDAATTQNITLSGTQTVDGVALVAGDRVLVKDQFVSSQTPSFNASTDTITVTTAPSNDTKVMFTNTGGALPTGLSETQIYYVINRTATTFQVALAQDGAVVTFSGAGTGTSAVGNVPSSANGIYTVSASTWTRATDANTDAEISAAQVAVIEGTQNGGKRFVTNFDVDNNIGSSTMEWKEVISGPSTATTLGGLRVTVSGTTLNLFTYV